MNDGRKISYLPGQLDVQGALSSAEQQIPQGLKEVIVIGFYDTGELFIRSSKMCRADALWLIESARTHCMSPMMGKLLGVK